MPNSYYNASGSPSQGSSGSSATMRGEFNAVVVGFDKLPNLGGNGGHAVFINAGATGMSSSGVVTLSGSTVTVTGDLNVTGALALADLTLTDELIVQGNTTLGNAAGDAVTIAGDAITWTGAPTHSGNHTFSGNLTVSGLFSANGGVVLGDAAGDALTVASSAVTWSNNPTHSGTHTFSNSINVGDVPGNAYTQLTTSGQLRRSSAAAGSLQFDTIIADGVSQSTTQFNRITNTSGPVLVQFLRGNGTATSDHNFTSGASGLLVDLARNGGYVKIGAGTPNPSTGGLAVSSGNSGATVNTSADELIVEGGSNSGISILSGAAATGFVLFGSSVNGARGQLNYNHSTDLLGLAVANANRVTLTSTEMTMLSGVELTLSNANPTNAFSAGYRGFATPIVSTATATNAGVGRVYNNTGAITINNGVFLAGDVVNVYNNSGASISITQGTITTMRLGGTATTGSRTLLARGMASLYFPTATECVVFGDVT